MDIIKDNKYKIYTGIGSGIFIFFLYLYYKYKNNEKNIILNDNNNIKNIINKQNETDRIIKILLVKLTKFMKYNKLNNDTLLLDRLNKASLFNKDFHTIRIAIDSINYNKGNCIKDIKNPNKITYLFTNNSDINIDGIGIINNVIGFKLIKAIIPNSSYNINDNNNLFVYKYNNIITNIPIKNGLYTPDKFIELFNNNNDFNCNLQIEYDSESLKFTISSLKSLINFDILWEYNENTKNLSRFLGWSSYNITNNNTYTSNNVIDMSTPYVDLIIKQIPKIACIKTPSGKHIIDRIPLDVNFAENKYYEPTYCDYKQNYFLPISLDRLDIVLEDPIYNTIYDSQNHHNSFEFELTVIKNPKNVGLINK